MILCHGGNDFLRRLEKAALKENLRRMILLAREAGADVVLVGVPQFGLLRSPAPLYAELATELELPYEEKILSEGDIVIEILGRNENLQQDLAIIPANRLPHIDYSVSNVLLITNYFHYLDKV